MKIAAKYIKLEFDNFLRKDNLKYFDIKNNSRTRKIPFIKSEILNDPSDIHKR